MKLRKAAASGAKAKGRISKSAVVVGFDILELITSGMYIDPLTIYREYIQNSADAIDEAKALRLLRKDEPGRVDIELDVRERRVRIRDNGTGIDPDEAPRLLTSIGASPKRSKRARGFRGIGRLAGLGYCREVVFRTRSGPSQPVFEMVWNGLALREAFRRTNHHEDLSGVVANIVDFETFSSDKLPSRFFEVELHSLIRHGNDVLLNPEAVCQYVAQVAPVPFSPEFSFGSAIGECISKYEPQTELHIHVDGSECPIYRPHRDEFPVSDSMNDRFLDVELQEFTGVDGEVAAVGWNLHHGYHGALPARAGIKGLRARIGNLQVGGTTVFEPVFPEPRFNHWTVGEIHVLDDRIIPNGRRDNFEQNVHLRSLENQLSPVARSIAKRCRSSSIRRNALRSLERCKQEVLDKRDLLKLSALSRPREKAVRESIQGLLLEMEHTLSRQVLDEKEQRRWSRQLSRLSGSVPGNFEKKGNAQSKNGSLEHLPKAKRTAYQEVIDLIYEYAPTPGAAKALISRILARIS